MTALPKTEPIGDALQSTAQPIDDDDDDDEGDEYIHGCLEK